MADALVSRRCRTSPNSTLPRQDFTMRIPRAKKLSKLQLLREDYRSKLLHEKEQKLNALLDRRIRENSLPRKGSVREFFLNRRKLANSNTKVGSRDRATLPPIQPNSRYDSVRSNRNKSADQESVPNTKAAIRINPTGKSKQNNLNQSGDTKEQDESSSELVKLRKGRRKVQELQRQGLEAKIDQTKASTLQPKERGPNLNFSTINDSKPHERKVILAPHKKKSHSEQVFKRGTKPSPRDETSGLCNDSSEHVQMQGQSWCTKTELSRSVAKIKELSRRKTAELLQMATKLPNELRESSQPSPRESAQKLDEMCKFEMELRETISRERKKLLPLKRRKDETKAERTGETSIRRAKTPGLKKVNATRSSVDDAHASKTDDIQNGASHESPRKQSLSRSPAKQSTQQKSTEMESKNAVDSTESISATAGLVGCSNCGRRFMKERISKHENACKKASARKKKPFDARKKRAEGTEMENYLNSEKKTTEQPAREKKKVNQWRIKHEHFIQTIRYAKGLQEKPPPALVNPDYIECSYCRRKFNPTVAERHIPWCKDIKSRTKPRKR